MSSPTSLLRLGYRVGAVADGLVALAMLGEAALGHASPITGYVPDVPYRFAMGLGGSLMLSWTLLLVWADRDPVARRGVLLLTILVVAGLMTTCVSATIAGYLPVATSIVLVGIELGLIALFAAGYLGSRPGRPA